ncbi:MAG TPA: hypothetical protein P5105_04580 [Victivallales bacterium]|nr:hypothetical protein [Victivallales bacterium]HPO89681.1 hypothetical protein [Victivallales bacterium]HRR06538.1 hypothetical protein [Victivallales bacterium]HRR27953.1 hypothetical protein [Victivallales bacterium]HRU00609.1 hypothetical protein [Victivallales bacterium]
MYKIEFYVPESDLEKVKDALFKAGAAVIGNYDCCAWQTKGEGQFRPLEGSNPYLGNLNKVEKVVEYKVELVCSDEKIKDVINALKESHPYETPAFQYWKVNPEL